MSTETKTVPESVPPLAAMIDKGKVDELASRGLKARAWAESVNIASPADAEAVWDAIKVCRSRMDQAKEFTEQARLKTYEAYEAVLEMRNRLIEPFKIADGILTPKLANWKAAEEQRLAEERATAQQAARKAEEERRLAQAQALEAEGRKDEADAVLSAPVEVPAVPAPEAETKLDGASLSTSWGVELVQLQPLVMYLLTERGQDHLRALSEDTKVVEAIEACFGRMARALRGALSVPGLRVIKVQGVRRTGAKAQKEPAA